VSINPFDLAIIHYVNGFAGRSRAFDALIHGFANNYLLKGAPLMAMLYWAWFRKEKPAAAKNETRARVLAICAASVLAPLLARVIAAVTPFRVRPMNEPALHFALPHFMSEGTAKIAAWSSFPSDNVALLFALVAGVFALSRRLGFVALVIGTLGAFARVYSGMHYPTDVLAGAVLGAASFVLVDRTRLKPLIARPALMLLEKNPGLFYAFFFLATDQIAHVLWESFVIVAYIATGVHLH